MQKVVAGTYVAQVESNTLDLIGQKETPALVLELKPISQMKSYIFVDGEFYTVRKPIFLTETLFKGGKHVGKSSIEVARADLEEVFGYSGDLSKENLAELNGKKCMIVVVINEKGYAEVKYLNRLGRGNSKPKSAAISDDLFRKLNGKFTGKTEEVKAPADFFEQFQK